VSARFYCTLPPQDGMLRLGADEARHMSRVCRLGVGDIVEVFDGRGYAVRAAIVSIESDSALLRAVGDRLPERSPPFSLTLATAVPKGDRFDWVVEKATELGIEELIPIMAERSVVEPGAPKIERLRRTIIEATKQCRRNRLMTISPPTPWERLAVDTPQPIKYLADPGGMPLARCPAIAANSPVILAVGPEGGFTGSERKLADENGWVTVSLSVNTLRIETAGLAGAAALFTRVKEPST
jgi:16S rRNA (uracil1498-N3)-methyltransferase